MGIDGFASAWESDFRQGLLGNFGSFDLGAFDIARENDFLLAQQAVELANVGALPLETRIALGIPAQPTGAMPMGFLDDVIETISGVTSTVGGVLGQIAQVGGNVIMAAQSIGQIINPNTGSVMPPGMMQPVMAGAMMQPSVGDGLDAFRAACMAQPGCQEKLAREIAMMNAATGSMGMPGMVPTLNTNAASIGTLLADPRVRAIATALGIGGALELGGAAATALVGGGGISAMQAGPLVMPWPAGMRYPRGIVLRAPDRPEKRYRTQGATLLSSGDVAAVRRVTKAASRARRGRRRSSARTVVVSTPAIGAVRNVCGSCLSAPCSCAR